MWYRSTITWHSELFLYTSHTQRARKISDKDDHICELVKFIYSENATKVCEISTVDLSYIVPGKSTVEISQNVVAFSE